MVKRAFLHAVEDAQHAADFGRFQIAAFPGLCFRRLHEIARVRQRQPVTHGIPKRLFQNLVRGLQCAWRNAVLSSLPVPRFYRVRLQILDRDAS